MKKINKQKTVWEDSPLGYASTPRHLGTFILLLVISCMLLAAYLGIDFGRHWDEEKIIWSVNTTVKTNKFLPEQYNFPSVSYYLALVSLIPPISTFLLDHAFIFDGLQYYLFGYVNSLQYILHVRAFFIFISSLSVIWVYLAVKRVTVHWLPAIISAASLAFSWEISYHMRWIARDTIMMQFGAATLLSVILAYTSKSLASSNKWQIMSAITAGLATGTKYTVGLLLIPVILTSIHKSKYALNQRSILQIVKLLVIFAVTYLITTPGTILETKDFIQDVRYELNLYNNGFGIYTVSPGIENFLQSFSYISIWLFSSGPVLSSIIIVLSAIGIFYLYRVKRPLTFIILSFPIAYFLFLITRSVMISRNYLMITPFLVFFVGIGFKYCIEKINPLLRVPFISAITLILFYNAYHITQAGYSVYTRPRTDYTRQVYQYIVDHPFDTFLVSPGVEYLLQSNMAVLPPNLTRSPNHSKFVIFHTAEITNKDFWIPNQRIYTQFGPQEINFNRYPTWSGSNRIIMVTISTAYKMGLFNSSSK